MRIIFEKKDFDKDGKLKRNMTLENGDEVFLMQDFAEPEKENEIKPEAKIEKIDKPLKVEKITDRLDDDLMPVNRRGGKIDAKNRDSNRILSKEILDFLEMNKENSFNLNVITSYIQERGLNKKHSQVTGMCNTMATEGLIIRKRTGYYQFNKI